MPAQDRKHKLRIARRTRKVQRLIEEKKKELERINPDDYASPQAYRKVITRERGKLHRLKQELTLLESGRLPGWR